MKAKVHHQILHVALFENYSFHAMPWRAQTEPDKGNPTLLWRVTFSKMRSTRHDLQTSFHMLDILTLRLNSENVLDVLCTDGLCTAKMCCHGVV